MERLPFSPIFMTGTLAELLFDLAQGHVEGFVFVDHVACLLVRRSVGWRPGLVPPVGCGGYSTGKELAVGPSERTREER